MYTLTLIEIFEEIKCVYLPVIYKQPSGYDTSFGSALFEGDTSIGSALFEGDTDRTNDIEKTILRLESLHRDIYNDDFDILKHIDVCDETKNFLCKDVCDCFMDKLNTSNIDSFLDNVKLMDKNLNQFKTIQESLKPFKKKTHKKDNLCASKEVLPSMKFLDTGDLYKDAIKAQSISMLKQKELGCFSRDFLLSDSIHNDKSSYDYNEIKSHNISNSIQFSYVNDKDQESENNNNKYNIPDLKPTKIDKTISFHVYYNTYFETYHITDYEIEKKYFPEIEFVDTIKDKNKLESLICKETVLSLSDLKNFIIIVNKHDEGVIIREVKEKIMYNYTISEDVKDKIKSSILVGKIIDICGMKDNEQQTKLIKRIIPSILYEVGLKKKRYSDGNYWYGLKPNNVSVDPKLTSLDEYVKFRVKESLLIEKTFATNVSN